MDVLNRTHISLVHLAINRIKDVYEKLHRVTSRMAIVLRDNVELQRYRCPGENALDLECLVEDTEIHKLDEVLPLMKRFWREIKVLHRIYLASLNHGSCNFAVRSKYMQYHIAITEILGQIHFLSGRFKDMLYQVEHIPDRSVFILKDVRINLRLLECQFCYFISKNFVHCLGGYIVPSTKNPVIDFSGDEFPTWHECYTAFSNFFGSF